MILLGVVTRAVPADRESRSHVGSVVTAERRGPAGPWAGTLAPARPVARVAPSLWYPLSARAPLGTQWEASRFALQAESPGVGDHSSLASGDSGRLSALATATRASGSAPWPRCREPLGLACLTVENRGRSVNSNFGKTSN